MKQKSRKNRNLFLQHQSIFSNFLVAKTINYKEHHTILTNNSEASLLFSPKSSKENKMNYPTNLSTLFNKKKIPPLNLPTLVNNPKMNQNESGKPKTTRIHFPKFDCLFKREEEEKRRQKEIAETEKKIAKKLEMILKGQRARTYSNIYEYKYEAQSSFSPQRETKFKFVGYGYKEEIGNFKSERKRENKSAIVIAISNVVKRKDEVLQNKIKIDKIVNNKFDNKGYVGNGRMYKKLKIKEKIRSIGSANGYYGKMMRKGKNDQSKNNKENKNSSDKENDKEKEGKIEEEKEKDQDKEENKKEDIDIEIKEEEKANIEPQKMENIKKKLKGMFKIKKPPNQNIKPIISASINPKETNDSKSVAEKPKSFLLSIIEAVNKRDNPEPDPESQPEPETQNNNQNQSEDLKTSLSQPKTSKPSKKSKSLNKQKNEPEPKYENSNNPNNTNSPNNPNNDIEIIAQKTQTSEIRFYSLVTLTPKEKKFLSKMSPHPLRSKLIISPKYSQFTYLSIQHVKSLINLLPQKPERIVYFTPPMFVDSRRNTLNDAINFEDVISSQLNDFTFVIFNDNNCSGGISHYFLDKYFEMFPQVISDFILGKTEEIHPASRVKRKINTLDLCKGKTTMDIKNLTHFEKIIKQRDHILFYQRAIFQDYTSQYDIGWVKEQLQYKKALKAFQFLFKKKLLQEEIEPPLSTDPQRNDGEKIQVNRRPKRTNLKLLKKENAFNIAGQRQNIQFSENELLKYTNWKIDERLNALLIKIYNTMNIDKGKDEYKLNVFRLLTHCIVNLEEELFVKIFYKFRDVFDINISDQKNNTMLIFAVKANAIKTTKFLLMNGADPDVKNAYGNTVMHYAVSYKLFEMVDLLRKFNAREDLRNIYGKSPWECLNGSCEDQ